MDFSQLPKMSKTPPPPTDPVSDASPVAPTSPPADAPVATALPTDRVPYRQEIAYPGFGMGGVWISLISGIICMLLGLNFAKWLLATLRGEPFNTGWVQPDGVTPVTYFQLQGGTAWSDTGLFLMGIALLLDAGLMLIAFRGQSAPRGLVAMAVLITGTALLINIGVAIYLLSLGILPLVSLIALLVGGMVLFDHLPLLRARRVP